MDKFVDLSTWIPVAEAKAMIAELIEQGMYTREQIKKSSNLFANKKDKSDGYVCRVLAISGLHPELELKKETKAKKTKAPKKVVQVVEPQVVDTRRYVVCAELIDEKEGLFLIDQSGKFWVEKQQIGTNVREVISKVVDTEEEARWIWNEARLRAK